MKRWVEVTLIVIGLGVWGYVVGSALMGADPWVLPAGTVQR